MCSEIRKQLKIGRFWRFFNVTIFIPRGYSEFNDSPFFAVILPKIAIFTFFRQLAPEIGQFEQHEQQRIGYETGCLYYFRRGM